MANYTKILIFFCIYFNLFLALGDRVSQIVYYGLTNFINTTTKGTCLAFILIYPLANIIMITLYLLTQSDLNITVGTKIKYFFYYVLSAEVCFSIGVHKSFRSKFSRYSDSIIVTKKVINAMHIIFISLPQILIITVHSSSIGAFCTIDVISLVFSCAFIMWSTMYYIMCNVKEADFVVELEDIVN